MYSAPQDGAIDAKGHQRKLTSPGSSSLQYGLWNGAEWELCALWSRAIMPYENKAPPLSTRRSVCVLRTIVRR